MKKKILLFGATGMAGHIAYYYLKSTGKYDIVNIVYRTKLTEDSIVVDITNHDQVIETVKNQNPDIILNCIGVLVKGSKDHPDNAIYVNAYFPHLLKKIADEINSKVIHISTDCVFSGRKGYYSEEDFRDADDVYGRSKALGELINDKDLTIRTSIVGPELKEKGEGLFHWFMKQRGDVYGYCTAIWGGVTTLELAKAIDFAIEENVKGLVHLSNGIEISKYDLLNLFKEIWSRGDIDILPFDGNNINKSMRRSARFSYIVPDYREMLLELSDWMTLHQNDYYRIY